jgi:RNA-directed DNA polymerase
MKRIGNIYSKIISIENLKLAEQKARKGKSKQYGVQHFDKNAAKNLAALHEMLKSKVFATSPYETFLVFEPKEREVYRLPYFPDRIVHHAVMNHLESVFVSVFTDDTYSCIKGKGIHAGQRAVEKALKDVSGTQYCLKLDIRKFYPNIDHDVLKSLLRRKIKDTNLLWLLDEIIVSAPGLPIGNYLSQYFANYYLAYFDHWIKEEKSVQYYFRYADDIVILSDSKAHLHQILSYIRDYFTVNLRLEIKSNYQVFPVAVRGIDFLGYRFYHTHTMLRKTIKQNFARSMAKGNNPASLAAYYGWAKHANTKHLLKKLLNDDQFRRLKNTTKNRALQRRQDQDLKGAEPRDTSAEIQDCQLQI